MESEKASVPAKSKWRRNVRAILIFLVVFVPLWFFKIIENRLIFIPSPFPSDNIKWRPTDFEYEDVDFATPDGKKLNGWYVPAENPRAVVLFCHGNAGNIADREEIMRALRKLAVTAFFFDYRGYGKSTGSPSEEGVLIDARAARTWLANRAKAPENDIVVMGESIGGAVAVDLAANGGARGLVVFSTFGTLKEVGNFHYPQLAWLTRSKFDSLSKIRKYHGPLMMTHGDADTIVPFKFGRALFDAANEPKVFHKVPGGDHNDPIPPSIWVDLDKFIKSLGDE